MSTVCMRLDIYLSIYVTYLACCLHLHLSVAWPPRGRRLVFAQLPFLRRYLLLLREWRTEAEGGGEDGLFASPPPPP